MHRCDQVCSSVTQPPCVRIASIPVMVQSVFRRCGSSIMMSHSMSCMVLLLFQMFRVGIHYAERSLVRDRLFVHRLPSVQGVLRQSYPPPRCFPSSWRVCNAAGSCGLLFVLTLLETQAPVAFSRDLSFQPFYIYLCSLVPGCLQLSWHAPQRSWIPRHAFA